MVGSRRSWTIAAICFLTLVVLAGGFYVTRGPLEPMASVAPPLRMNELAIRVDPILPNKPDIEVMRRSELSDVVDPKMFEIDGPHSSSQATIEQRSRVEFEMAPPMARMAPPPVAQPAPRPPARPAEREQIAAAARPAELDEAAVEAEVARRAKPAVVKFEIETKMAMGQVYEAKLEILRPGGGRESLITGTPELNERVQILNKARATISSAHMKIERLLPEWQENPHGRPGVLDLEGRTSEAGESPAVGPGRARRDLRQAGTHLQRRAVPQDDRDRSGLLAKRPGGPSRIFALDHSDRSDRRGAGGNCRVRCCRPGLAAQSKKSAPQGR